MSKRTKRSVTGAGDDQATSVVLKGRPSESLMPKISKSKVKWLQELLLDAGMSLEHGADNDWGWETQGAADHIANEAGLKLHDVNFNDPNSANYKLYMEALALHKKNHDITKKEVAVIAAGPTAADIAAREAAARLAADAAARAAEEAKIPAGVRGTQYDPRYLKTVSDAELANILKDGLHGLREITGGAFGSYRRDGQLDEFTAGKIYEQEKKLLGMGGRERGETGLDRATLERLATSMGVKIAGDTGLAPRDPSIPGTPTTNPSIAGSEYDPARLATVSTTELLATIKDGLLAKREISRGERNDPFFAQTREFEKEVFKQEIKLGIVTKGHETMDPEVLRILAAKLGNDAAVSTGLDVDPAIRAVIDQARTNGTLPPQGAVNAVPTAGGNQPYAPTPAVPGKPLSTGADIGTTR